MTTTKPQARIALSISVSPPEISLSHPEQTLKLNVTAGTSSSSKPSSGVTLNARWTALDEDNGIFKGAILLRSTDDSTYLNLAPPVMVSYSREGQNEDLSKSTSEHFVIAPSSASGQALTVTHDLTVQRLFRFAQLQPSDVKPGTQFKLLFNTMKLPAYWWSFQDEVEGKKLFEGILADENGYGGMNSDDPEAVKKRQSEGWAFSYPLGDLVFDVKDSDEAVFTFVE